MLLSVLPLLASALSAPIAADRLEELLLGPCARGKRVDQPLTAPVEGFLTTTAMDHPQREKGGDGAEHLVEHREAAPRPLLAREPLGDEPPGEQIARPPVLGLDAGLPEAPGEERGIVEAAVRLVPAEPAPVAADEAFVAAFDQVVETVVVLGRDVDAAPRPELSADPAEERAVVVQVLDDVFGEDEVVLTVHGVRIRVGERDLHAVAEAFLG